jgi:hypothetical protein
MDNRRHRVELASAVLLALATMLSAWCAYQSARWNGVQSIKFSDANALRAESLRQSDLGDQRRAIDVGLWVRYVAAHSEKNQELVDFLAQRFPPELKAANDAWLASNPLTNPSAPKSPFAMPEYVLPSLQEADRLRGLADQSAEEAKNANQRSDNYVLLTVIFASVLFFGGVGAKFETARLRELNVIVGFLVLLGTVFVVVEFPVY